MKIAIIGAGWYGCHIGLSLTQAGHNVDIFEKSSNTISGASKRNQNRLHLGFHYPRCNVTRQQSKKGYDWFIEHYEHLTRKISNNWYSIADTESYIDYETYKIIMEGSGLEFEEVPLQKNFTKMSNFLQCEEMVVRNDLATNYFDTILKNNIRFNQYVDLNNESVMKTLEGKFDYIIDCSWGTAKKINGLDYFYEPCVYFYYKKKAEVKEFALTIMDGQHYSLYPYYDDIYTLTSVKNTPLGQYDELNEAIAELAKAKNSKKVIEIKKRTFESEFESYYPGFLKDFDFVDVEFSLKTKVRSGTDFRGCIVKNDGKLISVFSGKIDTLHIAEYEVFKIING
ncbi:NAD(P)/FAD-dependent oxidoreductase [Vibrio sp. SG41-7]|uniref:FAD-dependent oxidoreductase n=1 Tax=Vibrio sp. SG41-7 TaxID=2760973 RepID=UPI001601C947|nr:FAD-dependent oxidoreductase [Vibrio sp. SG41-7]MBB1464843.1 NAD(P)/FAD-dependent oxidoreductase [Vibrio sp. SG41-7]